MSKPFVSPPPYGINEFDGTSKPKPMHTPGPKPHYHANRLGVLEACYHRITARGYATGLLLWTISFPFEHYLWLHVPGFSNISHWLGL